MIEIQDLAKTYGEERAVDGISFSVEQGEILGFLGPNGAGKTTTMKVLTGYLPPTAGRVRVDGLEVAEHSLQVRERIGYLPEHTPLYLEMNTVDYLDFIGALRGLDTEERERRIPEMIEVCGLEEVLSKRIDELSKGYRQRVGLAQAMIHDPPILILDEPTTGLDPNQIVEIRELIKSLGEEKTVLLSTHILQEVQASCDRVLIIHHGKLVADGTPDDLQSRFSGGQRVSFGVKTPDGVAEAVSDSVGELPGVEILERAPQPDGTTVYELAIDRDEDVRPELFELAVDRGWTMTELHREEANLESVFQQLTAGEPNTAAAAAR